MSERMVISDLSEGMRSPVDPRRELCITHRGPSPWLCLLQEELVSDSPKEHCRIVLVCLFFFFFGPCYVAFRILVPHLGIEPGPPAVEAWNPNHWTSREVSVGLYFNNSKCLHKTCCVSGTFISILQRLIHLIFISLWDKYYYNPCFTNTKNMTWKC